MWLVVGLGNPTHKFDFTRHNTGFMAADSLVSKLDFPKGTLEFSKNKKLGAGVVKTNIYGEDIIIAKPTSFMNNSGIAVKKLLDFYKISSDRLVVICDDSNLNVAILRLRYGGDPGGHRGLESIIETIGSEFWRARVGIGQNRGMTLENYVLAKIPPEERKKIDAALDKLSEELISLISHGALASKTIN